MAKIKQLKSISNGEYITVEEAAHQLEMKTSTVRTYLWSGRFCTYKFKNLTLLDAKEVQQWKVDHQS